MPKYLNVHQHQGGVVLLWCKLFKNWGLVEVKYAQNVPKVMCTNICNVICDLLLLKPVFLSWNVQWIVLSFCPVFPEIPSKIQQLVMAPESVMKCSRFYCYFNLESITKTSCRVVQFILCPDVTSTNVQKRMFHPNKIQFCLYTSLLSIQD